MAKQTKAKDLRELSIEKLIEQLDESREKLMRMRFQKATGELKDQNVPRQTRRDIARLVTILKQKQAEAGPSAPTEKQAEPKAEKTAKPKAEKKPAKKKAAKTEKKTEGEA